MTVDDLKEKLRLLKSLKDDYKDHKRQHDRIRLEHDRLQAELHAFMSDANIPAIKVENNQFVVKKTEFGYVQDKEAFEAWCTENQVEDIYLKTTEEKQRISELVRGALAAGTELPPGVTFYVREYISATESL